MQIACDGCTNQDRCNTERLACLEYVKHGERGTNPTHKLYLRMTGQNIDKANERLTRLERLYADGKTTIAEVQHWIESNVKRERIRELTVPESIKAKVMIKMWRQFGDRVELRDFV